MVRKSIPESERIYVVFNFCNTTHFFTLSEQIKGWIGALYKCFEIVNHEVDAYNNNPHNGSKCDYIDFDKIQEYLNNYQNINIGNHTIGIIDIKVSKIFFKNPLIIIKV